MKIIICTCGKRILVVPDVDAMVKAIESHATKHKGVEEHLTREVLLAISQ